MSELNGQTSSDGNQSPAMGECPNCSRPTLASELKIYRGVCQFCRRAFMDANFTWVQGKQQHAEDRSNPSHLHFNPLRPGESDGIIFTDGHREEFIDFDYDKIDESLGVINSSSDDAREDAAIVLSHLMAWVWAVRVKVQKDNTKQWFDHAMLKFVILTAGIRPDLLQGLTYEEIGQAFGVTKQNVSKSALRFQTAFELKLGRSRSDIARANMSRSRLERNAIRKRKDSFDENP